MITYFIIVILIAFSALFSGLTLGLMSLNSSELKRKVSLGDKRAAKVYAVRKNGNLLLTTLLIGNVSINAILSIFLSSITSGVMAVLVSTSLIVIFGEITPQAIFARHALSLGSRTAWIVKIFIVIFFPIAWPISFILNKTLGAELPNVYSKKELIKIIEEHEDTHESDLDEDEERIVKGALTFSGKQVKDVMTPKVITKTLSTSQKINKDLLQTLAEWGHSRIPVYHDEFPSKVVGILYLRQLLGGQNIGKTVGQVANETVFYVKENKRLDVTFNDFLRTRNHLFVVNNESKEMSGVITLEDILEEIIKSEIMDEQDKHQDVRKLVSLIKNKVN